MEYLEHETNNTLAGDLPDADADAGGIMTVRVVRIDARREQLHAVIQALDGLAKHDAWPEEHLFKVRLVVEELGLNIIEYAHRNDVPGEVEIRLSSRDGALKIEFIDEAPLFDPLRETPVPDTSAGIEQQPIGGLGVSLVRKMMDEVYYAREGNKNRLTLVARL